MLRWKHTLVLVFLASMGLGSTGCIKRSILAFEDHPKFPITSLQVFVTKSYYVYAEREHRFYNCTDAGDKLVCKRVCGTGTDVGCPTAISTSYGSSSNVR